VVVELAAVDLPVIRERSSENETPEYGSSPRMRRISARVSLPMVANVSFSSAGGWAEASRGPSSVILEGFTADRQYGSAPGASSLPGGDRPRGAGRSERRSGPRHRQTDDPPPKPPVVTIQRLETFEGAGATVVRLTTDDGDRGIGQLASGGEEIATQVFHDYVAPHALGADPGDVEGLIDGIMASPDHPRPYKYPGTFLLRALCGLDTALWDLRGRRRGASVCELLGGASDPDPVTAYGSRLSRETDGDEEAEICTRYLDEGGLDAFKLKVGKRLAFDTDEDVWPGRTEDVVSTVREAVGPEVDLMVDANSAYSREAAIEVGEEVLEPNGVVHYEEPCPYWELEWTADVREALDVPVAGGEQNNLVSQWGKQWERIVRTPVVDIAQPDVGYIGGVTRTKRVADMAADAGLTCVPHGPNHSLQKVFTIHTMAAIDNAGPYPFEYRIPEDGEPEAMYAPEPLVEDGAVAVPDGPGWGVEVNDEWLAQSDYERSEA